jgi:hypothetical protein
MEKMSFGEKNSDVHSLDTWIFFNDMRLKTGHQDFLDAHNLVIS